MLANSKLTILKIGGNVINDEVCLQRVLKGFAQIEGYKILVHGGGKRASQLSKQMGLTPKMIDGRRITDATTLDIVTMVYAGLLNKNVVAQLQTLGCNALGLCGADMNVIQSHKRIVKTIDYGFVGDVDAINTTAIKNLLSIGATPIFCAITHDANGQLLNTNADTVAAELAAGMAAVIPVELWYCFEKKGVLSDANDHDAVIDSITPDYYEQLKTDGVITDGMIPKMDNAFMALSSGVTSVLICGPDAVANGEKIGTILKNKKL